MASGCSGPTHSILLSMFTRRRTGCGAALATLYIFTAAWLSSAVQVQVQGQDVKNAFEPPITGRYEGSLIKEQSVRAFDRTTMMTSRSAQGKFAGIAVEGKRTVTALQGPRGRSALEIFTNYANALKGAGFRTEFACGREKCPRGMLIDGLGANGNVELSRALAIFGDGSIEDEHYLVASRNVPNGTEYIRIAARGPKLPVVVIDLVQPAAMETHVKVVEAGKIASDLATSGHVSLYAVFFDFDKADLKPESRPQLEELAKYLSSNPTINVYIVGHTDGKGKMEYNSDLSRRRAAAVVTAVTSQFGIPAARLSAHGVGPLAPLGTNDTEEGRALNRRVEVVKRLE